MILIFLIILVATIIILYLLYQKYHNMTYVKSDIDDEFYLVRDVPDKISGANLLAQIKKNILIIDNHLTTNKSNYSTHTAHIEQLHNRIANVIITESSSDSSYTSYSVNKGEQIVFCLRSRDNNGKLHNINLIMYVVLHEISHVACPEYGHTELFKKIFAFITNIAIELKLYNKIPFGESAVEYCGLMITDSII